MRRVREWFLEPLNAYTNEVFAREFDSQTESFEKGAFRQRKPVKVWQCSESQRDFYARNRGPSELQFNVWTAFQGEPLRFWPIDGKKREAISKARKRVKALKEGKKVPKLMVNSKES